MTFLSAEQSVEDSEPRELVSISINGTVTHTHTSATRDISYNGTLYTSIATERGAIAVTMPGEEKDLTITLPIDHALCRRWTRQAIPPKTVTAIIYRQNGGETEQIWTGQITDMQVDKSVAKFRVPSRAGEWMLRTIPVYTVGRQCPHVLYGAACGVSRTGSSPAGLAHKVTTTVLSVNGRDIRVDLGSTDRNGTWAENGEVLHVATQERMTVGLQADASPGTSAIATLTMQMQIVGLSVGDSVEVYRGCAHTITACNADFGNRQAFGGFPSLPNKNPFVLGGTGTEGL